MNSATAARTDCCHCGTRFFPSDHERDYCCAGCRVVHEWITGQGLGRFYELKGNRVTEAVGNRVFEPVDWSWADDLQAEVESREDTPETSLQVRGLSCVACAWLIEQRFQDRPGAGRIEVFPERGLTLLTWQAGVFSLREFLADIHRFGYEASLPTEPVERRDKLAVRLGLCGGLAMNTMAFTLPRYLGLDPASDLGVLCNVIALTSASLCLLVGGGYFFQRAWLALRERMLHIDLPISLGLLIAAGSTFAGWFTRIESLFYVDFLATFTFLMLLGRWLQERALAAAQRRLQRDQNLPGNPASIQAGDPFTLRPGEIAPVEALLEDDSASFSREWITGEPDPVPLQSGQVASAGSRLISGEPRTFRARESFAGSTLDQLLQRRPTPRDPLLQRVLALYLVAVFVLAVGGAVFWLLRNDGVTALQVAVSILVVSCPCALGVAVPLLNARAAQRLEGEGIFLRESSLWSRLPGVRQIVFDKTGTLTLPVPALRNPEVLESLTPQTRRALRHLVATNRHPVARAVHEALPAADEPLQARIREEPGNGVCFRDDESGSVWSLGRPGWRSPRGDHQAVLARDGLELAGFDFQEALRPDATTEVSRLRNGGAHLAILSGDRPERVTAVAASVGIASHRSRGGCTPDDKADWLIANDAPHTLFVGDGFNDAQALGAARCSAVAAAGAALPVEANADFLFLGRGLSAIRRLFDLAAERRRTLILVFFFAVLYNIVAVIICWQGRMSPLLAAILMPASSLVTLAIASRGGKTGSRR